VKYKDLKGNKKKKNEELKKELDLVSTANSTSAGRTASTTVWMNAGEGEWGVPVLKIQQGAISFLTPLKYA